MLMIASSVKRQQVISLTVDAADADDEQEDDDDVLYPVRTFRFHVRLLWWL